MNTMQSATSRAIATRCCWLPQKLDREFLCLIGDADLLKQCHGVLFRFPVPETVGRHRLEDAVFEDGHMREEVETLGHHARRAADEINRFRVAAFAVGRQTGFLENGPTWLQPLTNGNVAAALGCHETTVSRIRTGLTVETPERVLPLSAFFARGGTVGSDGANVPGPAIAALIAGLILAEPQEEPLTDTDIARTLGARGIHISRRTIANRRREAGFPGAAERLKGRRTT